MIDRASVHHSKLSFLSAPCYKSPPELSIRRNEIGTTSSQHQRCAEYGLASATACGMRTVYKRQKLSGYSGPGLAETEFLGPTIAFLYPEFAKFLSELWSLTVGTLFWGLESWDSVGDQSRLVSLLICITNTDVYFTLFAYFYQTLP